MPLSEEELNLVFEVVEVIIDRKIEDALGRDSLGEQIRESQLREDCINVIAFGEKLTE